MALMYIPGHDRDALEADREQLLIDALVDMFDAVEIDEEDLPLQDARALLDQLAYDEWAAIGDEYTPSPDDQALAALAAQG